MKSALLLVNFGGPRSLSEVEPFLIELLCDKALVRTRLTPILHRLFFSRVAKKRAKKIAKEYEEIGGRSPIYFDTEEIAKFLKFSWGPNVLTFHRYLPETHEKSLEQIERCPADRITVFPFFPQFCSGTTGSIIAFFSKHLSPETRKKLHWIRSYPEHPAFISAYCNRIQTVLQENRLREEETILLFSAHGVPLSFIQSGDPYQKECEASFAACMAHFPKALGRLSYQSKFGKGEWLTPSTESVCQNILHWSQRKKACIVVPISFTSDQIETLFEIQKLYLPLIARQGVQAFAAPSLNRGADWLAAINQMLLVFVEDSDYRSRA